MGYVGWVQVFKDETPPREAPFTIQVYQEPGFEGEYVTATDGRVLERAGLTVFATSEEAREDARRRIEAAKGPSRLSHLPEVES